MSKYTNIGGSAVSIEKLQCLSLHKKKELIDLMLGSSPNDRLSIATAALPDMEMISDNFGQIILYTGMKYADKEGKNIIPFEKDNKDPYEEEEEEEPISDGDIDSDIDDDLMPDTVRNPLIINNPITQHISADNR